MIDHHDSRCDLRGDVMPARRRWRLSQGCLDGPGGHGYEGPDLKCVLKARERAGARNTLQQLSALGAMSLEWPSFTKLLLKSWITS